MKKLRCMRRKILQNKNKTKRVKYSAALNSTAASVCGKPDAFQLSLNKSCSYLML